MLKTDFMEKLRLFSEELKTLGKFIESGFVWHFSDNDLLMNVLREQSEHANPSGLGDFRQLVGRLFQ